jgi:hypothetical protein
MKNRITVSIPFSFKGKTLSPRSTIDLDEHMEMLGSIPCIYNHIAEENDISPYSYEHDVMMMGELEFEAAEGMAAEFIHDNQFDVEAFEVKWKQEKVNSRFQKIIAGALAAKDSPPQGFSQTLERALNEVYEMGREDGRAEMKIPSTTDHLF